MLSHSTVIVVVVADFVAGFVIVNDIDNVLSKHKWSPPLSVKNYHSRHASIS